MNECKRCSSTVSTEISNRQLQATGRLATKSVYVVATSRYTNILRWPYRKKSNGVRSGDLGTHRTRFLPPILRPEYAMTNQSRTGVQKCAGAPS
ncbi:uncharacterized protein TNCV_2467251 [Trichonephila clavipes]|nr:uncharacterized protein TNCV_2467251 [Trichonephila clavipes]